MTPGGNRTKPRPGVRGRRQASREPGGLVGKRDEPLPAFADVGFPHARVQFQFLNPGTLGGDSFFGCLESGLQLVSRGSSMAQLGEERVGGALERAESPVEAGEAVPLRLDPREQILLVRGVQTPHAVGLGLVVRPGGLQMLFTVGHEQPGLILSLSQRGTGLAHLRSTVGPEVIIAATPKMTAAMTRSSRGRLKDGMNRGCLRMPPPYDACTQIAPKQGATTYQTYPRSSGRRSARSRPSISASTCAR